jgi:acetyl esterase/lipase
VNAHTPRVKAALGAVLILAAACGPVAAHAPTAARSPGPTALAVATPTPVRPFADMAVATGQAACPATGQYEDIYYPDWPGRPVPAIIFIHGGGWTSGTRADVTAAEPLLTVLRSKGYAVVSIDYRLAPAYRWPAMFDDSRCALDNLRASAPALGIDPARIGVVGYSAGAQLALLLAFELPAAERPAAVAEISGPVDLTRPDFAAGESAAVGEQVFGTQDPNAPVLRQASPITYVQAGDPPVFILHGTADATVPYEQAQELADALRRAGDTVVLAPVAGGGHDLGPSAAAAGAQLFAFLKTYFPA